MVPINNLIVFHEARALVRLVAGIEARFDELSHHIKRAAVAVASHIAAGAGAGSAKGFRQSLTMARTAVNEVHAQLEIATDLGCIADEHPAMELSDRIGRRLTCFIRTLDPG